MEGATAQTAFDIGTDRLELQRPGHGGSVAFEVLHDVQRPVLVGDHHQLGAVGRYLDVGGILNLDDEVLLEVTSEFGIDGQLHRSLPSTNRASRLTGPLVGLPDVSQSPNLSNVQYR